MTVTGYFRLYIAVLHIHLIRVGDLFRSPSDSALCQVVYGYLNSYLVARQNFYKVHSELARNMCGNNVLVRKLNLEYGIRQSLNNRTLKFYNVILWQNNPSLIID